MAPHQPVFNPRIIFTVTEGNLELDVTHGFAANHVQLLAECVEEVVTSSGLPKDTPAREKSSCVLG